jgi:hypothetical protein
MPIDRIYNDIYSVIYESESDDIFKWIVYAKDKNKKIEENYIIVEISKKTLNEIVNSSLKMYDDAELFWTSPFLNGKVKILNNEVLKDKLFYRVILNFKDSKEVIIEYSIFEEEFHIKEYK